MLPLGFRFDVDAVLAGGVAHRSDCDRVSRPLPEDAVSVAADRIHWAERCPRECPDCQPPFQTLPGHQLQPPLAVLTR